MTGGPIRPRYSPFARRPLPLFWGNPLFEAAEGAVFCRIGLLGPGDCSSGTQELDGLPGLRGGSASRSPLDHQDLLVRLPRTQDVLSDFTAVAFCPVGRLVP